MLSIYLALLSILVGSLTAQSTMMEGVNSPGVDEETADGASSPVKAILVVIGMVGVSAAVVLLANCRQRTVMDDQVSFSSAVEEENELSSIRVTGGPVLIERPSSRAVHVTVELGGLPPVSEEWENGCNDSITSKYTISNDWSVNSPYKTEIGSTTSLTSHTPVSSVVNSFVNSDNLGDLESAHPLRPSSYLRVETSMCSLSGSEAVYTP